jgi:hypothetical protein
VCINCLTYLDTSNACCQILQVLWLGISHFEVGVTLGFIVVNTQLKEVNSF